MTASRGARRGAPAVVAERLAAQMLSGRPARDPVAVARALLAVQAQDPRGARLAIRARSKARSAGEVDAALSEDRSLLITWLNRGTLHLKVTLEPFGRLARADREALEAEAEAVLRYLAGTAGRAPRSQLTSISVKPS